MKHGARRPGEDAVDIAVLYEGRIMGLVDRAQATAKQLGLLMAGVAG